VASPSSTLRATPTRPSTLSLSDPRWLAFTQAHPESLCFHRPAWAALLADCYGYDPFVLALEDERGAVVAGLPVLEIRRLGRKRWVALPYSDYCPPLLAEGVDSSTFAEELERARVAAEIRSLEVRAPVPTHGPRQRPEAVLHRTQLGTDADALFSRFHRSQVQRNVKRAGREGIVVRQAETQRDLTNSFYELQLQTRRRLGMPMQPRRFFAALWSHLLEPGHGFLLLAYSGTKPVAGAVFLTGSETMTYKYGASDASSWRLRPNHLLFWTAMRSACDAGYGWFDFGRSDLEDRGLREFKSGWGAVEQDLVYTKLPEPEPASAGARALPGIRAVIRRSPAWVSRLSGELLYRYAA
jgi:CelD/BcsL family acetyltransferase involved in cellulose biosynthesis